MRSNVLRRYALTARALFLSALRIVYNTSAFMSNLVGPLPHAQNAMYFSSISFHHCMVVHVYILNKTTRVLRDSLLKYFTCVIVLKAWSRTKVGCEEQVLQKKWLRCRFPCILRTPVLDLSCRVNAAVYSGVLGPRC